MKKILIIFVALLLSFSLSATWGRIQYINEFGEVDPSNSDPYQITDGLMERNGKKNYFYQARVICSPPREFGALGDIKINIFDENGDYVLFQDSGEAKIKVKLISGEIEEFTHSFDVSEEYSYLLNEYEIEEMKENIHLDGNGATTLLNELYRGNNLKFVIYYGKTKYSFTIEGEGFKNLSDTFISNYVVLEEEEYYYEGMKYGLSYYFKQKINDKNYVVGVHYTDYTSFGKYPNLSLSLNYKNIDDKFYYDNEGEYIYKNVNLISRNKENALSLQEWIENDEYGSYFNLDDYKTIKKISDFASLNGQANLKIKLEPNVMLNIPLTTEKLKKIIQLI